MVEITQDEAMKIKQVYRDAYIIRTKRKYKIEEVHVVMELLNEIRSQEKIVSEYSKNKN